MSLISRIHVQFTRMARALPAFQPHIRSMDFNEKGKAEENVYFRKEQERLLAKLRKLFSSQQKDVQSSSSVAGNDNKAPKSTDQSDKK